MYRMSYVFIVLALLTQSTLVNGQIDPYYFKGEKWMDEEGAAVTTFYYTLGDGAWPNADPFRMVVIGDSIAWGTGLYKWEKSHYLVANWLQNTLKRPVEVTVLAHTGATIQNPPPNNLLSMIFDEKKHTFIDPELGSWDPTLFEQADHIPNPGDVDLILVSGGANDIGLGNLLYPIDNSNEINIRCLEIRDSMNILLRKLLEKCDKSMIIVTSYYTAVTKDTPSSSIEKFADFVLKTDPNTGHKFASYLIQGGKDVISDNCAKFESQSKSSLGDSIGGAVYFANKFSGSQFGKKRVYFAPVNFPADRSYGTSQSLLWELIDAEDGGKTNDRKYCYRTSLCQRVKCNFDDKIQAIAHPNVDGANEYANAIETVITNEELFGINAQQPSMQIIPQLWDSISVLALTQIETFLSYGDNYLADYWNQPTGLQKAEAESWKQKGFDFFIQNRFDEAIQAYYKALEICPRDTSSWNRIGSSYFGLRKYKEAVKAFEKAEEINPQYVDYDKIVVLPNLNRYEEALEAIDKKIESDPEYYLYWLDRATFLINLGKYDEAIQASEKAIDLDPKDSSGWYYKGIALIGQGRYDEAIKAYDNAIDLDPNDKDAWIAKGNALNAQGKRDEAIKVFEKAIKIKPTYEPEVAWMAKGDALYNYGKFGDALKCYNKAIKSAPQYVDPLINKGNALEQVFDLNEAEKTYAKALEICENDLEMYPQLVNLWLAKGDILRLLGRNSEAKEAYAEAYRLRYDS